MLDRRAPSAIIIAALACLRCRNLPGLSYFDSSACYNLYSRLYRACNSQCVSILDGRESERGEEFCYV